MTEGREGLHPLWYAAAAVVAAGAGTLAVRGDLPVVQNDTPEAESPERPLFSLDIEAGDPEVSAADIWNATVEVHVVADHERHYSANGVHIGTGEILVPNAFSSMVREFEGDGSTLTRWIEAGGPESEWFDPSEDSPVTNGLETVWVADPTFSVMPSLEVAPPMEDFPGRIVYMLTGPEDEVAISTGVVVGFKEHEDDRFGTDAIVAVRGNVAPDPQEALDGSTALDIGSPVVDAAGVLGVVEGFRVLEDLSPEDAEANGLAESEVGQTVTLVRMSFRTDLAA